VLILSEQLGRFRQVFTDGRGYPTDPHPAYFGYALGKWDGDAFVIESTGFNDMSWLDDSGHPHSDALKTTERFRRLDFGHMEMQITIDDPKTYVRPFTATIPFELLPDTELIEDVCESHGATHNGRRLGSFGWVSNFSFYYAHHMSTIEGGMVCTDDDRVYQQLRMLRGHGMVRESTDADERASWRGAYPDLNPDFIFAHPAYNVRNTEIGGIMGRSQLKRLDANVVQRTKNLHRFLNRIDAARYRTDFKLEGSSNYAFNLIMKDADDDFVERLMATMRETGIEFRRGSAGGGNQVCQPYLRGIVPADHHREFPNTEHVHFYGFYIGNFPDIRDDEIDAICRIVNGV